MEEEKANNQRKNNFDWLKEYSWQKGQSGNPKGRPKGKSLKEYSREFLANMSEEARIDFLKELPAETIWKMAEGNPESKTDLTSNGKTIVLPMEILNKNATDTSPEPNSEIN